MKDDASWDYGIFSLYVFGFILGVSRNPFVGFALEEEQT